LAVDQGHPKSTTNFQLILAGHEFAANYLSPHCTKMISIYAVDSINIIKLVVDHGVFAGSDRLP
jgi:hypothetical protein